MSEAQFRSIARFPGYRFGDDGSVWSAWERCARKGKMGASWQIGQGWRQLKLRLNSWGRPCVSLRDTNGDRKVLRVCRLILEAFVGPSPPGMECCHFPDRNPANNRLDNIRWDTRLANCADHYFHRMESWMDNRERWHGNAKLTEDDVRTIRSMAASGETLRKIAQQFKIGTPYCSMIVYRKTWKHI